MDLIGAARETRTLTGKPHLALNQACLPIPAQPLMRHNKLMTTHIQVGRFWYGDKTANKKRDRFNL